VSDIIKTWPAFMPRRKVLAIFRSKFAMFYFTIGKGRPKQAIEYLWFTHQGEILGHFAVKEIVCNVGQLPKLRSLEDRESEWQIKLDRYVAICPGPFTQTPSAEPIYCDSFRGFRYFDFDAYCQTAESRIAI
jgi:hypothetical protein